MAARLTETQKKKIVADYICLNSYNAVAKINGCSPNTVKSVVNNADNAEFAEKCTRKKEEVSHSIMEYLESQTDRACEIIGKGFWNCQSRRSWKPPQCLRSQRQSVH